MAVSPTPPPPARPTRGASRFSRRRATASRACVWVATWSGVGKRGKKGRKIHSGKLRRSCTHPCTRVSLSYAPSRGTILHTCARQHATLALSTKASGRNGTGTVERNSIRSGKNHRRSRSRSSVHHSCTAAIVARKRTRSIARKEINQSESFVTISRIKIKRTLIG